VGVESEDCELKVAAALLELERVGSRSSDASLLAAIKRQVKYSIAKLYILSSINPAGRGTRISWHQL